MANINGWSRGTWSEGAWGQPLPVQVTGVQAVGNPDPRASSDMRYVAFSNQIVRALYAGTKVYVDGSLSTTLASVGDTTTVNVTDGSSKIIATDRPVQIAGNNNSLAAAPFSWAGVSFSTRIDRENDSKFVVQAISGQTEVRIYKGTDTTPTFTLTTDPTTLAEATNLFGTYGTQVWSIESDSPIVVVSTAVSDNSDTDVLYPESTELYGHGGRLTSTDARTNSTGFTVTTYRSELGTTQSSTLSTTSQDPAVSGRGTQYSLGNYTRSTASTPFSLRVEADADGVQTTIAVAPEALATHFTLPDTAEFLAIVAPEEADGSSVTLYDSSGTQLYTTTFSLASGAVSGTPCALYLLNTSIGVTMSAGTRIVSDYPCFIVWEDDNPDEDETILFGSGSFDNPIANSSISADAVVSVTGVSAIHGVGVVSITGAASVPSTGVDASTAVGSVSVVIQSAVDVTGLEATSSVGSVTSTGTAVVSPTGVEESGEVGDVSISADSLAAFTGVEATGEVDSVSVSSQAVVSVTGVEATGEENNPSIIGDSNLDLSGVEGTASVGIAVASGGTDIPVTGLVATTQLGDIAPIINSAGASASVGVVSVNGTVNVIVSGVDSTAEVGSVSVSAGADAPATGIAASGNVGTVTVSEGAGIDVNVTGVESSGAANNPEVIGDSSVTPTGIAASTAVNDVSVNGASSVPVTGLEATSEVGSVTASAAAGVAVTGVESSTSTNDVSVTGDSSLQLTGLESTSAVNDVSVNGASSVPVTGLEATGVVNGLIRNETVYITASSASGWGRSLWGSGTWSQPVGDDIGMTGEVNDVVVTPRIRVPVTGIEVTTGVGSVIVETGTGVDVPVTGVEAQGLLGPRGVTVWGRIVPSETAVWTKIAPSTTTEYTQIRP